MSSNEAYSGYGRSRAFALGSPSRVSQAPSKSRVSNSRRTSGVWKSATRQHRLSACRTSRNQICSPFVE